MGRRKRRHDELVENASVSDQRKAVKQQKLHGNEAIESEKQSGESCQCEDRPGKQEAAPLSDAQIETFMRDGFVLLKNAFSSETASAIRELIWERLAHDGIHQQDSSTWVERHGIPGSTNGWS